MVNKCGEINLFDVPLWPTDNGCIHCHFHPAVLHSRIVRAPGDQRKNHCVRNAGGINNIACNCALVHTTVVVYSTDLKGWFENYINTDKLSVNKMVLVCYMTTMF